MWGTLHNRKLLWHGSRLTNFVGIISQGLRIAPPEAPKTGYMFGKGLYFADMASKSLNYCHASKHKPTGLGLICEVALGDSYCLTEADEDITWDMVNNLGCHSTKGQGTTCIDAAGNHTLPNGSVIPLGTPKQSGIPDSDLLYDEYVVYQVSQVRMKYLVRVHFNFLD